MKNNKKAETMSTVVKIILALLFLGAMIYIMYYTGIFEKFKQSLTIKCTGSCKFTCNLDSEFEDSGATCTNNQKCCIPYDYSGGGGSGGGASSGGDNTEKVEGTQCEKSKYKVYDVYGFCVDKCNYCADLNNKKARAKICDKKINSDFNCVCAKKELELLKPSGNAIEGYCSADALYCCNEKFKDEKPPKIEFIIKPEPLSGSYKGNYEIEVFCDDEGGSGCSNQGKFIFSNKINTVRCDSQLYFSNYETLTLQNNIGKILVNSETLKEIYGFDKNGFKGNAYVYLCLNDTFGNLALERTRAMPIILPGTSTQCRNKITNGICATNIAPCYIDNNIIDAPNYVGLLCKEIYFDSLGNSFKTLKECNDFLARNKDYCN